MNQNILKIIVPKLQKAEPIFLLMTFVGFSFKMFHWAGAAIMLIIGMSTLAIIYLYSAVLQAEGFMPAKAALVYKISYLGLSIVMVGILFKSMIWGGGDLQLTMGLIATGLSLVAILVLRNKPDYENAFTFKTIARLLAFGLIGGFLLSVSERDIMNFNHKDDPEYVRLFFNMKEHPKEAEAAEKFRAYQLNKQKIEREKMLDYLE